MVQAKSKTIVRHILDVILILLYNIPRWLSFIVLIRTLNRGFQTF